MISNVSVSRISRKEKVSCLGELWLIFFIDVFKKLFLDVHFLSLSGFVKCVKYLLRASNTLLWFFIIFPYSYKTIVFIALLLPEKTGFIADQNFLLSVITFGFRLLKWLVLVPFKMERHLFLRCLYFFQFSDVRDLLNSFRSLDLSIISF